jgi:hypothetical protein
MITDVESLTRLGPVFPLAQRTRDGSCSCRKSGCARPGAHPLHDLWWTTVSRDPGVLEAVWRDSPDAGPAVLIQRGTGVLQVPRALYPVLSGALLADGVDPAPLVLSPQRAWLFTTAVTLAQHRPPHARPLPEADELVMLPTGAWVPLPPTHLPREGPVWWSTPPRSALLPPSVVHRLITALLVARNRLIRTGGDGPAPSNSSSRHREA